MGLHAERLQGKGSRVPGTLGSIHSFLQRRSTQLTRGIGKRGYAPENMLVPASASKGHQHFLSFRHPGIERPSGREEMEYCRAWHSP